MPALPTVLSIAGWDSSGGAGMARDFRAFMDCDVKGMGAITAITAQSHMRVLSVQHARPDIVRAQISEALASGTIGAIKIGMLGTRATVDAVVNALPSREAMPIVVDPIWTASSGGVLLDPDGWQAMRVSLLPRATLVTPNLREGCALLGVSISENQTTFDVDEAALTTQARQLLALGASAVLLKGGHASGAESIDVLVRANGEASYLRAPRIATPLRGTGCALSSSIAAWLARGFALPAACHQAKKYVTTLLRAEAPRSIE